MHADTHLYLDRFRATELRASASADRLARECTTRGTVARRPGAVRHRVGWTLVEVGLRLVQSPGLVQPPRRVTPRAA
ncbi:hypothetical protein ABT112_23885 [Streptomyces sp. NPDC002055]|uniref:hypothetical protein n=1 Tax=Streptomyces sp. NPDC002055 TaxID=3154534 RepID=UPI00331C17C0